VIRFVLATVVLCGALAGAGVLVTSAHGWRHCRISHGESSVAFQLKPRPVVLQRPVYTQGC
jgi:hypothetical protein